jgi:hypothetical protein
MTGVGVVERRPLPVRGYQATGSTLLAIGLSVLLIGAGYGLKLFFDSRTVAVSAAGVTAQAPAGWRVDSSATELIVRHPGDGDTLYAASVISGAADELADVAAATTLDRAGGLLLGFQVTGQSPVRVGDRDGYQISYAYVTQPGQSRTPKLIEGVDLYIPADQQIIAVSYEAPREHFAEDYAAFERFAASAQVSDQ